MSQPELFQGWNLQPSDERPSRPHDVTRNWPAARNKSNSPSSFDETRNFGPKEDSGLTLGFRLPTDDPTPSESRPSANETVCSAEARGEVEKKPGAPIHFPSIGDGIGGFRLVSELGRGAFGRVYLAEEAGLGNRPVALKVSMPEGDEPKLLARLQHTHIVPIHSVHDDPESGLRLMCMPYFGGANLAQVLEAAGSDMPSETRERSLIAALDIVAKPAISEAAASSKYGTAQRSAAEFGEPSRDEPKDDSRNTPSMMRSILGRMPWRIRSNPAISRPIEDRDPMEPARQFLRQASFVRASAWITARLAEGLDHAHSRGLLHRDLKPSNILIAADGTPMLLDFNLAAESLVTAEEGTKAMMGGTLPYMSPEHLDAFNPHGATRPEDVNERSDIYAMGLILFEMVAGRHPFAEPPPNRPILEVVRWMTIERRKPAPSPRAINRQVPAGLDAIIRKSIDPNPRKRHARAGDLAEDLRRFLDDRPLKYTPEPSLIEVVAKWARRNPKVTSASTIGLIAVGLIALIIGGAWTMTHNYRIVEARLRLRVFETRFQECQFLLNTAGGPVEHLGRGIGLAESAIRQAGLGEPGGRGPESWLGSLATTERDEMRRDLSELILLVARARVVQAERSKSEEKRRRALEAGVDQLDRAERIDPSPPRALFEERARYHAALGQSAEAARDRKRAETTPPATGRDFYLLGTAHLARGRVDRAEQDLLRAVALDDRPFWAWFALGLCHYDQGRFAESAGDFAVCTVVAPKFAWPWMNRGLALARAGRLVEATEAYNRALSIDGEFPEALVNRGLTRLELGQAPTAAEDLEKAIKLGHQDSSVKAALAEALARSGRTTEGLRQLDQLIESEPDVPLLRIIRGTIRLATDRAGAEADFRKVLTLEPRHAGANLGLARLLMPNPAAALPHADLAVESDPARLEALELRALLRARLGSDKTIDDVNRLIQAPTPHRLYNAACALALLNEAHPDPALVARTLELLRRALETGFPRDHLKSDPDLKSIRDDPTFPGLVGAN